MKDALNNMTFPRAIILVSLLGSAILGYMVWGSSNRLDEINGQAQRAPQSIKELHSEAVGLDVLARIASDEGIDAEGNIDLYIRTIAKHSMVRIGNVEITPNQDSISREVEDLRYRIKPSDPKAKFSRMQIGNFLYKLEKDSNRVKVTNLKITPADRLKPGEIGRDAWHFEAEVTSRHKIGS